MTINDKIIHLLEHPEARHETLRDGTLILEVHLADYLHDDLSRRFGVKYSLYFAPRGAANGCGVLMYCAYQAEVLRALRDGMTEAAPEASQRGEADNA